MGVFYESLAGLMAVDDINSVLISAAVLIGVLFDRLGFPVVDSLVSLGIAALMLKSAIDLGRETIRIAGGEVPDLSQYELGIEKRIWEIRKYRFKFWILFLLWEPRTSGELEEIFSEKNARVLRHVAERLKGRLGHGTVLRRMHVRVDGQGAGREGW